MHIKSHDRRKLGTSSERGGGKGDGSKDDLPRRTVHFKSDDDDRQLHYVQTQESLEASESAAEPRGSKSAGRKVYIAAADDDPQNAGSRQIPQPTSSQLSQQEQERQIYTTIPPPTVAETNIRDYNNLLELDAGNSYREYILKLLLKCSPRLVFVHAMIQNELCLEFALASANNMCEGLGLSFNMTTRTPGSVFRKSKMEHVSRARVNPDDIINFMIAHVDYPVLVGCDFDDLLSLDGRTNKLLNDYCYLTNGAEISVCYKCKDRTSYISENRKLPLCSFHAKSYRGRLQMFQPLFVSVGAYSDGIQLYVLMYNCDSNESDPLLSAVWVPLAYRITKRFMARKSIKHADILMDMAYAQEMDWRSSSSKDPLNVVKTLQNLCLAEPDEWKIGKLPSLM